MSVKVLLTRSIRNSASMGTINSFYRSAMDLKGDFANWLNLYNRQRR